MKPRNFEASPLSELELGTMLKAAPKEEKWTKN